MQLEHFHPPHPDLAGEGVCPNPKNHLDLPVLLSYNTATMILAIHSVSNVFGYNIEI